MKYVLIALIVQSASCINYFRSDMSSACPKSEQKVEECVANAFSNILLLLRKGVPKYRIRVAEPFTVPLVEMNRKFNEQLEGNVVTKNIVAYGLTYGNISDLVFDSDTYYFNILYPKLLIHLDYKGYVIISELFVNSEGRTSWELRNVKSHVVMTTKPLGKNKRKHYAVSELNMQLDVEDMRVKAISNKPEEQPLLDFVINMVNQDMKYFMVVFEPIYSQVIDGFMHDGFNQVLSHIPANKLFNE